MDYLKSMRNNSKNKKVYLLDNVDWFKSVKMFEEIIFFLNLAVLTIIWGYMYPVPS